MLADAPVDARRFFFRVARMDWQPPNENEAATVLQLIDHSTDRVAEPRQGEVRSAEFCKRPTRGVSVPQRAVEIIEISLIELNQPVVRLFDVFGSPSGSPSDPLHVHVRHMAPSTIART